MKIGILGGGQLAMMLASSAQKLGLKPLCFGPPCCPAHHVSPTTEDLLHLQIHSQVLIIENEFLNDSQEKVLKTAPFCPSLDVIKLFSNKLEQKKLFDRLGLPTSRWMEKPTNLPAQMWIKHIHKQFPKGCVIKWARMGYDGLGTHFLKSQDFDLAIDFVKKAEGQPIYAEEHIPFDKELAQVTAFSTDKNTFYHFPLVETVQTNGVCQSVYRYEEDQEENLNLAQQARSYGEKLASSCLLFGTFAIEFFLKAGQLFVNEVAPRVHNSGHWSQNTSLSQFEAHLRAVLGRPFPKNVTYPRYFGMHNILGQIKKQVNRSKKLIDVDGNPSVCWYGKKQLRPRRKMGHVNFMTNDLTDKQRLDQTSKQISWSLAK